MASLPALDRPNQAARSIVQLNQHLRQHPLRWSLILSCALFIVIAGQFWLVTPILETPDALGHYHYARTLARSGQFPTLPSSDSLYSAAEEAGQFPLYYLISAGLLQLFPDDDLDQVLVPDPHNLAGAGLTHNYSFHRPFSGFPHGAELAARVVEALSMVCGAATVACCILLARLYKPMDPGLWLAAGAAAAVLPAFASLSSGVSNDNLVTALCSMTIVLLAQWLSDRRKLWSWLSVAALWLAVLAKFNAIGLLGCWLLLSLWRTPGRSWFKELTKLGLVGAVVDGWWLARNVQLYGDPSAMTAINRQMQGAGYAPFQVSPSQALQHIGAELPKAYQTFFVEFGHYNIDAPRVFLLVAGLSSVGLALGVVQALRDSRNQQTRLILLWPVIVLLEVVAYVLLSNADGRFLYPALAPLAVLTASGWRWVLGWLNWRLFGLALAPACALGASLSAWLVVKPAYAYPPMLDTLPSSVDPVYASFANAVELRGVDAGSAERVKPGQPQPLTVYWRRMGRLDLPLSEFIHIESSDPGYVAGAGYEGVAGGNFPPNFWPEGKVIEDRHELTLSQDVRPDRRNAVVLSVRAGMYYVSSHAGASAERVAADPREAAESGLALASWKIEGQPPKDMPAQPVAEFRNGLTLLEAQKSSASEKELAVDLRWLARSAQGADDTVFVQTLSPDGVVIGQHDSRPLEGRYDTRLWSPGEQVFDRVRLTLSQPLTADCRVIVGLYVLPNSTSRIPTETGQAFAVIPQ